MNEALLHDLDDIQFRISEFLQNLSSQASVYKQAPEKWNILEVMEHLNISDKSSMLAILRDGGPETEDHVRSSTNKINEMLAYNGQGWVAPQAAEPSGKFRNTEEALDTFIKTRMKLRKFAEENELNHIAGGFDHPRLGTLSKAQWMQFLVWHANHHFKQMNQIADAYQNAKS
ncbi:MAG: DinB family protein [Bacteroidetes bacterium]|nr:DinB family protein [Bacteroidota bacterium]